MFYEQNHLVFVFHHYGAKKFRQLSFGRIDTLKRHIDSGHADKIKCDFCKKKNDQPKARYVANTIRIKLNRVISKNFDHGDC